MISIEKMKEAEGKRVRLTFKSERIKEGFCVSYEAPADEDEEPMLFIDDNFAEVQSNIVKIEILDEEDEK